MLNENLKLNGNLSIVLRDSTGAVKETRDVKNLVVYTGLAYAISRMVGTAKGVMTHMAIGSDNTPAAASQTDLLSILGSRVALTSSTISGTHDEKIIYVATFGAGVSTGAVTEAGIFNDSTAGDMLCRSVFGVVTKGAGDSMTITWTISLAAV